MTDKNPGISGEYQYTKNLSAPVHFHLVDLVLGLARSAAAVAHGLSDGRQYGHGDQAENDQHEQGGHDEPGRAELSVKRVKGLVGELFKVEADGGLDEVSVEVAGDIVDELKCHAG